MFSWILPIVSMGYFELSHQNTYKFIGTETLALPHTYRAVWWRWRHCGADKATRTTIKRKKNSSRERKTEEYEEEIKKGTKRAAAAEKRKMWMTIHLCYGMVKKKGTKRRSHVKYSVHHSANAAADDAMLSQHDFHSTNIKYTYPSIIWHNRPTFDVNEILLYATASSSAMCVHHPKYLDGTRSPNE